MELLTVNEAAAILRTSPDTIRRMARNGKIARIRVGGQWRIQDTITMNDGTVVAISSFAKKTPETPLPSQGA
jgi:excisionase family DNA binding protein